MSHRLRRRLALLLALATGAGAALHADEAGASSQLEGRPAATQASPLQARIDAAAAGATVAVGPGVYVGDLVIDKPLTLAGSGRPRLVGSGTGSVVRVRADDVTVTGFDVDGRGGGDLGRDASGIHVAGARVRIEDCRIERCLFGVYLYQADDATVAGCRIHGIPGLAPGEKGSGIHLWNSQRFRVERNVLTDVRDGFYVQSSSHGIVRDNVARDLRYGLHYMYSDDNLFEGNLFANGDAGTAIMYSRRIVFRRNRFVHNRGFASVGLLFKECDHVLAEDNLVADNARGIFLEGTRDSVLRGNLVSDSDVAVVLYDSCAAVRLTRNTFVANLSPLQLSGRRTDTAFDGNYWSGNDEPDLDGDGVADRPYRLTSVFDHLRGNLTAADLMAQGFAAAALGAAEQSFPVLDPIPVEDPRPLARPPASRVPPPGDAVARAPHFAGLAGSLAALVLGAAVLASGRSPR